MFWVSSRRFDQNENHRLKKRIIVLYTRETKNKTETENGIKRKNMN